ncbi:RNA polymerase sigma-70 factor, ECF subfamily [Granulicella rosea]|uniref:RNA polymerase sigma-70 factor, ECF subfamily n=2 Tax=Granulicella rosea TaxID=474952 RepID=A0A239ES49_9BACT|nr:RNA polymerase sigma-70 factor, ECF subfamily [Granulicella rosea]
MQIALDASMIRLSEQVEFISELDDIDVLVRTYKPRLLRFVAFSIGDQDIAESITQDCFLRAYNGRASFRGDCSVSTWLFSIANNLIRDHLRTKKFQFWRKARATALDITDIASSVPDGMSSPETRMLAHERAGQVRQAIELLSENQRRVFLMRFTEELTLQEISDTIGMPINTVKTHLHRAVVAVRAQLGGSR